MTRYDAGTLDLQASNDFVLVLRTVPFPVKVERGKDLTVSVEFKGHQADLDGIYLESTGRGNQITALQLVHLYGRPPIDEIVIRVPRKSFVEIDHCHDVSIMGVDGGISADVFRHAHLTVDSYDSARVGARVGAHIELRHGKGDLSVSADDATVEIESANHYATSISASTATIKATGRFGAVKGDVSESYVSIQGVDVNEISKWANMTAYYEALTSAESPGLGR